jgi:hypothetical protein
MRRVFLVLAVIALLTLSAMPAMADKRGNNGWGHYNNNSWGTTTLHFAIGTQAGQRATSGDGTIGAIALGGAGTSSGRN